MYNIMKVLYKKGRKYKPQFVKEFKRKKDAENHLRKAMQALKVKGIDKVDLCTNTVYVPCGIKVQFVIEKAASTPNGQGCTLLNVPMSAVPSQNVGKHKKVKIKRKP